MTRSCSWKLLIISNNRSFSLCISIFLLRTVNCKHTVWSKKTWHTVVVSKSTVELTLSVLFIFTCIHLRPYLKLNGKFTDWKNGIGNDGQKTKHEDAIISIEYVHIKEQSRICPRVDPVADNGYSDWVIDNVVIAHRWKVGIPTRNIDSCN